jgi:hypothetical protein
MIVQVERLWKFMTKGLDFGLGLWKLHTMPERRLQSYILLAKVETPIHDNIRELVTRECKEHGVNIMNVLANPKGSVGRWNLNFWRLEQFYTIF